MAGKHKFGGIGAKGSARMNFFNPSAPLREKYGEGHVNQEHFKNLTITGECQQVFSQWSKSKCAKYNVTHQDFPSITFQITKNNFPVKVEREAIFESKKAAAVPQENVVPPPLVSEQSPNNQAIHLSRTHATSSVSGRLVFTVCHQRGNLDMADIADILALGLQIDNEDPRPENLPNAMLNQLGRGFIQLFAFAFRTQMAKTWMDDFQKWVGESLQRQMRSNYLRWALLFLILLFNLVVHVIFCDIG